MILGDSIRDLIGKIPKQQRENIINQQLRTIFRFTNGSQIVILPNSENQLRGFTADLIVVDEGAFFHNDEEIFRIILPPMLATTGGTLIVSSTPWGKNTVFYQLNQDPNYEKRIVTWRDATAEGRYSTDFLEQLRNEQEVRPEVFRMEYEAEFVEEVDTWLSQDFLAKSCSGEVELLDFESEQRGRFYAGVDLAEHVDHSVVAVVRRDGDRLDLVHMFRFKRGTSIASVIGYVKVLSDRWSRVESIYVDKTKHGDYIVNDMREAGLAQAEGVNFTLESKQEMAQILKQRMTGGLLRIPFEREIIDELNVERYEPHEDRQDRLQPPRRHTRRPILGPRPRRHRSRAPHDRHPHQSTLTQSKRNSSCTVAEQYQTRSKKTRKTSQNKKRNQKNRLKTRSKKRSPFNKHIPHAREKWGPFS
jgi:phage FluMu gp28-like protein